MTRRRLIRLAKADDADGMTVPIAHINAVETRHNDWHKPHVMVGGQRITMTQEAAREVAAIVQAYWSDDEHEAPIVVDPDGWRRPLRADPADRLPDGLGDRGA